MGAFSLRLQVPSEAGLFCLLLRGFSEPGRYSLPSPGPPRSPSGTGSCCSSGRICHPRRTCGKWRGGGNQGVAQDDFYWKDSGLSQVRLRLDFFFFVSEGRLALGIKYSGLSPQEIGSNDVAHGAQGAPIEHIFSLAGQRCGSLPVCEHTWPFFVVEGAILDLSLHSSRDWDWHDCPQGCYTSSREAGHWLGRGSGSSPGVTWPAFIKVFHGKSISLHPQKSSSRAILSAHPQSTTLKPKNTIFCWNKESSSSRGAVFP